jgi:uncharacterized protein
MKWETMKQLIDFLVEQYDPHRFVNLVSHFNVNFFGGEPFLNWEVMKKTFEYVEGIRKKKGIVFSLAILTNGSIWNKEIHEFLARYKSMMGPRLKFQVSIDGCEESHNINRPMVGGGDSFSTVAANIKKYRSIIPDIQVRETLVPSRVDKWYDDYVTLSSLSNFVQMTPIVENDWTSVLDKAKEQLIRINDLYLEQLKTNPCRWLSLLNSTIKDTNEAYEQGLCYRGCHAGDQLVGVTVDGELYPCHRFIAYRKYFDYKLGDVWKGIDKNSDKVDEVRKMHNANRECSGCKAFSCKRCYATNKFTEGNVEAAPKSGYCELCRIIQELADKLSDKLFAEHRCTLSPFSTYKSPTSKRRGIVMENGEKILASDAEDLVVQSMSVLLKTMMEIRNQNCKIIDLLSKVAGEKAGEKEPVAD